MISLIGTYLRILSSLSPILILCSVLGFRRCFMKLMFLGFALMDFVVPVNHLTLHCEPGCGFDLFPNFGQIFRVLSVILLFGLGFKLFPCDGFFSFFVWFVWKSAELKNRFCSKNIVDGRGEELKEDSCVDLIENMQKNEGKSNSIDASSDEEECDEHIESDLSAMRELIKIERHKTKTALSELAKERASSATAAEEAMAMIWRLQNEKGSISMESSQYRRLAEEKQIHDQQVIQSLHWLVCAHERERSLLEDQLKDCRLKLKKASSTGYCEEAGEPHSPTNGCILDALEEASYSSEEADLSPDGLV